MSKTPLVKKSATIGCVVLVAVVAYDFFETPSDHLGLPLPPRSPPGVLPARLAGEDQPHLGTPDPGAASGSAHDDLGAYYNFHLDMQRVEDLTVVAGTAAAGGILMTLVPPLVGGRRGTISATPATASTAANRRRTLRIPAPTSMRIGVAALGGAAMSALLINASMGGLALNWEGPLLSPGAPVSLTFSGYTTVEAVVVEHGEGLLRLRFAEIASRGEREWLRAACLQGRWFDDAQAPRRPRSV